MSESPKPTERLFVLYDGRAEDATDEASVYCCADTLKEAKRDKREMFPDACIWEYGVALSADGNRELINERRVYV